MQNKVNIIFDLDDTILDFRKGAQESLRRILAQYPVQDVRFEEWLEVFNAVNHKVWREIEAGGSPKEWLNTRFSTTYQQFNIEQDGVLLESMYRSLLDENFHVIDGAEKLLKSLKERGYKLIAGTNGQSSTQRKRLKGTGLDRLFEKVIISDEVGVAKPDPRFFANLFDNEEITPENTVMIGDSLRSDVQGAINAGITSVWFNPLELTNQTTIKPTYEVHSYKALRQLLTANESEYVQ